MISIYWFIDLIVYCQQAEITAEDMIEECDKDGNGSLSFDEFKQSTLANEIKL